MLSSLVAWFSAPAQWSASTGIPARLLQHLGYTALAVLVGAVIAVPLGLYIGHTGRGRLLVVGLANGLRALPELGVLVLFVLLIGLGLTPVVLALMLLAIPPLLAGTYSGISGVDPAAVDAARGIGMTESQILFQVELPNALPLMVAGLRTAVLQVVATATIAAFVSLGGLGRYIVDGQAQRDFTQMAGGAILVALLAIVLEVALQGLQRAVTPGTRRQEPARTDTVTAGG
ncbi:ABC transporter permease [Actinomycetospora termitidis]|uniref:ABC transporter permease n=1 Tax=Actinomycetospora termitidis TaxID=3053470 RepID=A0ABT7M8Z0_9PSEU|nr:ABC transporter permease [Actinomycetospora sp. Odt1-22]MDL5157144.1 ABC transporter permease [Actinomycetospora sp. Odt1-22]